ncbi:MAG TPA: selenocysteine-specific translation elongation factor [Actinomycetota bacterium]|nr:selenocysteine-specific translation elongation factor [Actinomycetota bacterium]
MHVVGTAGHVDHGKSTLVHALTGIDPDRFEEEKRRGLTIDLGFAWCSLPSGREIGIVDVPGHERFIRNMLAGVGGIDAAIFVVAADEGWMPQSAEHLQILDFLDVSSGVVALTKSDIAPDIEGVAGEIRRRLSGTCLDGAAIVPVSGTTRSGLDDLLAALDDALAGIPVAPDRGRARMYVDRSFTIAGAGTVVTGTLENGSLAVGEEVEILPSHHRARIRSLQTHRRTVDLARPGSRVAANLAGLERSALARGDAIAHPGRYAPTNVFAARLRTARGMQHELTERGAYEVYVGSAETSCTIKFLSPGSSELVQIFTRRALPLAADDRFVVRDVGRSATVAGGVVLDVAPSVVRRGDSEAIQRLKAREDKSGAELAALIVAERGIVRRDELALLSGYVGDVTDPSVTTAGSFALNSGYASRLLARTLSALGSHHASNPLERGMSRNALAAQLGLDAGALDELIALWPDVVVEGSAVRLAEHGVALGPAERDAADRALDKLRAGGASPPGLRELGVPFSLAKALERAGELVVISPDIAYPADVWQSVTRRVVDLLSSTGAATVSQLREAIGTSRKYAVPLLEHLDASGITRRKGDVRELGPRA